MANSTALVTGASSGIGAAFARALAGRSDDVVLVARSEARLKELAAELEREHGVTAEVLEADLESDEGLARVEARLRDAARTIELLVNNAGFGTSGRFHELPIEGEVAEIRLNILALVRCAHAALGPMVERGHGGVINVSSVGAYQPTPNSATYRGEQGVRQQLHERDPRGAQGHRRESDGARAGLHPYGVPRARRDREHRLDARFLWQTADEVAKAALKAYDRGRAVCVPGAMNTIAAAFSGSMPAGVSRKIAGMVTKRAYSI